MDENEEIEHPTEFTVVKAKPIEPEPSNVWPRILSLITVMSFVMLCAMTIAQKPIQAAIDQLTDKYKKEAKVAICEQAYRSQNMYATYMKNAFTSGCMSHTKFGLLTATKDEKRKEYIEKMFADESFSPEHEKYSGPCQVMGDEFMRQFEIKKTITSWFWQDLKCNELSPEDKEKATE